MVGLLDIAPVARKVEIRGTTLSVKGLSLKAFRDLIVAFPDVAAMLAGKPDAGVLIMQAPEAVAAIIAAGLGAKPEEADRISELVVDEQLALLNHIVELTLPNGIGPFVALMEKMGAGKGGGAPAMRAPDMSLPPQLQASSAPDTLKKK